MRVEREFLKSVRHLFKEVDGFTDSLHFHFTFNAHIFQSISLTVSVVKEEFLSSLYGSLRKYANSVIPINHHDFCIAVGVHRVVGKPDLVSFPSCVNDKVVIQIKQETAHVFVIDLASAVCFILGDDLPTVLGDELIFLNRFFDEDAPPSHVRRCE